MVTEISDSTEQKKNEKKVLAQTLVDKQNPEMITFVLSAEVDNIAALKTIGEDIDNHREDLFGEEKAIGFLTSFIHNNLVIRTSIKGKRSVQLVDTINAVSREEVYAGNPLGGLFPQPSVMKR